MTVITTPRAPAAIGPYSQGIAAGALLFVSGQLPLDPINNTMPAEPAAQARQAMENLQAVLEAAGSALHKVVKVTLFLQNMDHFAIINEVYAGFFSSSFPARSCVQVARLPKDALLEIEAIALT
jgi:2-iminobutanoate/2-iminopropanoate deaminase